MRTTAPEPTAAPARELISRPVHALGRVVRAAPRTVLAAVLAVTVVMLLVSGQAEDAARTNG